MVEPRWEMKIGAPVIATDGEYGRLQQLILDPYQERVVALLVRKHGLLSSHPILVPEEAVAEMTDREVRLRMSREQVDALPEYRPDIGLVVEGGTYRVDDGLLAVRGTEGIEVYRPSTGEHLRRYEGQPIGSEPAHLALQVRTDQPVFCPDGHVGRVSLLLLDPRGQVTGFVMQSGHLLGRNLIVPAAWVQEVDPRHVQLSVNKHALESLPEYSPDGALAADVKNALRADVALRGTDYHEIDATVQDGIVRLRGHVATEMDKSRAEEAARAIAGELDIENHLVVDEDLVIRVAQALGRDEHTRVEQVYVGARNGIIVLNGRVANAGVRDAAEAAAASVPQARGVVNYLQAPGVLIEEQKALQPPIGREVYATDVLLGNIERVIINPDNRRVTSFVAHGGLPDLQHANEHRLPYEIPQKERRVVVPIRAVRYETDSSVWLDVDSIEAARYHDFDATLFVSPQEDWLPPFPYHWDDVLFARERASGPNRPSSSVGPERGEDKKA